MIDIHAHILPGMDDGAEDLQDTLEMARMAVENGTMVMVATPHCNLPGIYDNYYDENYIETFRRVKRALQEHEIPLTLLPGLEVFATPDLPELIREGLIQTINGSRYLLLEFPFEEESEYVNAILDDVMKMGLCPVVAHAERYEFVQKGPGIVDQWKEKGILIQVNKASLMGKFGRAAYHAAHLMMRRFQVDVIASDCHRPYMRTPMMEDVYLSLARKYPEVYLAALFEENPEKICRNEAVTSFAAAHGLQFDGKHRI